MRLATPWGRGKRSLENVQPPNDTAHHQTQHRRRLRSDAALNQEPLACMVASSNRATERKQPFLVERSSGGTGPPEDRPLTQHLVQGPRQQFRILFDIRIGIDELACPERTARSRAAFERRQTQTRYQRRLRVVRNDSGLAECCHIWTFGPKSVAVPDKLSQKHPRGEERIEKSAFAPAPARDPTTARIFPPCMSADRHGPLLTPIGIDAMEVAAKRLACRRIYTRSDRWQAAAWKTMPASSK